MDVLACPSEVGHQNRNSHFASGLDPIARVQRLGLGIAEYRLEDDLALFSERLPRYFVTRSRNLESDRCRTESRVFLLARSRDILVVGIPKLEYGAIRESLYRDLSRLGSSGLSVELFVDGPLCSRNDALRFSFGFFVRIYLLRILSWGRGACVAWPVVQRRIVDTVSDRHPVVRVHLPFEEQWILCPFLLGRSSCTRHPNWDA